MDGCMVQKHDNTYKGRIVIYIDCANKSGTIRATIPIKEGL